MQTLTIPYRQPTMSGIKRDQAKKKKELIEALVRLQSTGLVSAATEKLNESAAEEASPVSVLLFVRISSESFRRKRHQ